MDDRFGEDGIENGKRSAMIGFVFAAVGILICAAIAAISCLLR